jgi:hypothetical protein
VRTEIAFNELVKFKFLTDQGFIRERRLPDLIRSKAYLFYDPFDFIEWVHSTYI